MKASFSFNNTCITHTWPDHYVTVNAETGLLKVDITLKSINIKWQTQPELKIVQEFKS